MTRQQSIPDLYQSAPHRCPYLPDQTAANLLIDPRFDVTAQFYDRLIGNGFRRNGDFYYRPHCPSCSACRSVRIPVNRFHPSRNQRRVNNRNKDLVLHLLKPVFSEEHFGLYRRYQASRHAGDSMDDPDPNKYRQFLIESKIDTFLVEIRLRHRLLALSVVDQVNDGLSAVYTIFDPDENQRSLGTFAILQLIELARKIHHDWVYLGYWIDGCQKMSYKSRFRPLETYHPDTGRWAAIEPSHVASGK
jgi:arginyl-tRNA--protein-N-Asp/Glu arginylyltransferase